MSVLLAWLIGWEPIFLLFSLALLVVTSLLYLCSPFCIWCMYTWLSWLYTSFTIVQAITVNFTWGRSMILCRCADKWPERSTYRSQSCILGPFDQSKSVFYVAGLDIMKVNNMFFGNPTLLSTWLKFPDNYCEILGMCKDVVHATIRLLNMVNKLFTVIVLYKFSKQT